MLLQQSLSLKLTQKPVLTQSLRQLVRLLQLNKLELKGEIQQELTENPVLELASERPGDEATPDAEGERSTEVADREMLDAAGLSADSKDSSEQEASDPFDDIDFDAYFNEYLDPGFKSPMAEVSEKPSFETFLSNSTSLTDHLLWQARMQAESEDALRVAQVVIGNLDDDGYLVATDEEIAAEVDADLTAVAEGVRLVQTLDPLGVGARNLGECLAIQILAWDDEECTAIRIVRECLDLLETANSTASVAERLGCSPEEAEDEIAFIKSLDPRPGQQYAVSQNRVVEPDVYFIKGEDGTFRVELNDEDLPELRLNRKYRSLMKRGAGEKAVRDYVRERYSSAIQLLRNIEQRQQTIRAVCELIAREQQSFLANGIDALRPLMMKDLADEIGVHPSTVSRAVANKFAHTPHGVYELRFFFSEAVQGREGASIPLVVLKRRVQQMIDDEDKAKPLTDDAISKQLQAGGIQVTRRTVAKYREDLGIASTHKRRVKKKKPA